MTALAIVLFAGFWVGVIFFTVYYSEDRVRPEDHPPLPEFDPQPERPRVDDDPSAP